MFDPIIGFPDSRETIDNAPTTEDIFIDDDLCSENDIEDDNQQIIDNVLKNINYRDI